MECKVKVELDLWMNLIGAILNLDRENRDEGWIPNSGDRFQKKGKNYAQQCVHNEFEVVLPEKRPGLFMIVTESEGGNLWACPRFHGFVY